jgi:hypothetical protein
MTPSGLASVRRGLTIIAIAAGLTTFLVQVSVLGCLGPSFAQIEAAKLTPAEKARAKLFVAEESWVNAKIVLADTITDLGIAGLSIPITARARILSVRDAGNLALSGARLALARGDVAEAGRFYQALTRLMDSTSALLSENSGLGL